MTMSLDQEMKKLENLRLELEKSGAFRPGTFTQDSMKSFCEELDNQCQQLGLEPETVFTDKARLTAACIAFHTNKNQFHDMVTLLFKPESLGKDHPHLNELKSITATIQFAMKNNGAVLEVVEKCNKDLTNVHKNTPKPTPTRTGLSDQEVQMEILHGRRAGTVHISLDPAYEAGDDEKGNPEESPLQEAEENDEYAPMAPKKPHPRGTLPL